jgi:hypothetical protein
VKTTVELPDPLFRQAKSRAAERGQTLKEFMTEALRDKLQKRDTPGVSEPQWMRGFGKLRRLHRETLRVQRSIEEAFETIEPEDQL